MFASLALTLAAALSVTVLNHIRSTGNITCLVAGMGDSDLIMVLR